MNVDYYIPTSIFKHINFKSASLGFILKVCRRIYSSCATCECCGDRSENSNN